MRVAYQFTCKGVYFCYFIGRQPYSKGSLSRAVHGVYRSFTEIFHLLSHSIFLIWPHFYDKSLEKYIRLIFLPHFTTTASVLYHSRYGFWQVHFRHLILHMRLALYLCNTASRILYFNPISCWNSAISLLSSSFWNYRNFYQTYRTLCLISSDCSFTWISKWRITCDTRNARIRNNCCLLCHVS